MTLAEKLRFLADRAKDGKEFYLGDEIMKFDSERLTKHLHDDWTYSNIEFNHIIYHDFKHKPQWEFTEDEKAILRSLPEQYRWIARHKSGQLTIHEYKPVKHHDDINWLDFKEYGFLSPFKHIFQSIKWSDDEPCEFRKYL